MLECWQAPLAEVFDDLEDYDTQRRSVLSFAQPDPSPTERAQSMLWALVKSNVFTFLLFPFILANPCILALGRYPEPPAEERATLRSLNKMFIVRRFRFGRLRVMYTVTCLDGRALPKHHTITKRVIETPTILVQVRTRALEGKTFVFSCVRGTSNVFETPLTRCRSLPSLWGPCSAGPAS